MFDSRVPRWHCLYSIGLVRLSKNRNNHIVRVALAGQFAHRFALMNHPPLGPSAPFRANLEPSILLWIMSRSKDEVFASCRNLLENRPAFLQAFIYEVTDFVNNAA